MPLFIADNSLRAVVLLLVVVALVPPLQAQPVTSHRNSLEWLTLRAEVIVHGVVTAVTPLNPHERFQQFYEVSLRSQSCIKGQAPRRLRFVTIQDAEYQKLLDEKRAALFFLTSSRRDFHRKMNDYFFTRCRWLCQQVFDLNAESIAAVSFHDAGIDEIADGREILSIVRDYAQTLRGGTSTLPYSLREPDRRAFSGYDSFLIVPLNQTLYDVAAQWSEKGGVQARIARNTLGEFSEVIEYAKAKSQLDEVPQVPTQWQHAATLSVDSLEWMATDCDLVVMGTVADAVLVQKGDPEDRTDFNKTLDRHIVELNVTDVIKGAAEKTISFAIDNGGKISQWQAEKVRVVVFLRDRKLPIQNKGGRSLILADHSQEPPLRYVGRGPDIKSIIAFDAAGHPPTFSTALTWTNDPREMLNIIRSYLACAAAGAESAPAVPRPICVRGVEKFWRGTPWEENQHVGLTFPINAHLEEHAQQWVNSADKLHRWLGVYMLAFFKSDQNAEMLRSLLDDPGRWQGPVHVSSYTHQRVTHLVRWEAWKTLTAWGYQVAAPDFGER